MPTREDVIARSIQCSITHPEKSPSLFSRIPSFFYIYWLTFVCTRADLFTALRGTWGIDEDDYDASLGGKEGQKHVLESMGDMGYSGSTFFKTHDSAYLIKSIPRHFEHTFFKQNLLLPYAEYMQANPTSLLVRITDFLECVQPSIGSLLGLAPTHHMAMENIMCGENDKPRDSSSGWESWDLKPMSYFYPERDVAGGVLSSEATKSKLADDFNEGIVLDLDQAEDFKAQLEKDTALLRDCNAVDYSLFLVRIPTPDTPDSFSQRRFQDASISKHIPSAKSPCVPPELPNWRTGIKSADSKFIYRASILDFFWAKHTVHAKAMTGLIKSYNLIDRQGPMSVTTTAPEYRKRFLHMCSEILEVKEAASENRA